MSNGRVAGVETPLGTIETERVICAAGVWSRELAATTAVDLPLRPEQRWMFFTEDAPEFPTRLPLTIDFRRVSTSTGRAMPSYFGGREQSIDELAPVAMQRVPSLETLGVRSSWWGYYEMTPDHNAIVCQTELPAGLCYATGFSGHGFQQAPVIGEHLAELALGLEPTFDLTPLSLGRFAVGRQRVEHNVV